MATAAVSQGRRCYYGDRIFGGGSRRTNLQPCLKLTMPLWEKEFCSKAGSFSSWEKFLEAKRYVHIYERVMVWDDSAAEVAFRNAKKRFKYEFLGLQMPSSMIGQLPSPDDCIDTNINWDDRDSNDSIDPELLLLDDPKGKEEEEGVEKVGATATAAANGALDDMPIEAIEPTGWDIDTTDNMNPLMGMVVGSDY